MAGKSGKAGRFAVAGLLGALAIGGGVAATAALRAPEGPASSEEAVELFFAALDNEDLVGVAEVMHPGERESLAQPMFDMAGHMRRLEILGADADPAAASFLDIQVDGVTYSVEALDPGLHYVTTTGGTISAPNNPQTPMGALWDRFDIEMPEADTTRTIADMADEPMKMAVVEVDGSWYVSLYYSGAEAARRDAKKLFPGLGNGPDPVGAATPDAVMEDMILAISDLDATGMLTLMDPSEAAVLYDYSPLFLPELQEGMDDAAAAAQLSDVEWSVDLVDFVANEVNGRQVVSLNEIKVSIEVGAGELSSTPVSGSFTIAGGCTTIIFDGETTQSCASDTSPEAEAARELFDRLLEVADLSDTTVRAFERMAAVDLGVTVVERDGRWYMSAMPTYLETINDLMTVLEPADLVAMGTDIEEIVDRQDEIGEEILDVLMDTDWEAFGNAERLAELEGLFGQLNNNGSPTLDFGDGSFGDGSDDAAMTDEEWQQFLDELEAGGAEPGTNPFGGEDAFAGVLAPSIEGSFDVDADGTYLAWFGDMTAAPGFEAAAFAYSGDASVEIIRFSAPVDPAAVLSSDFTIELVDGTTQATDQFGNTFAFVENYVIWGETTSAEGEAVFNEQVTFLKGL
ncbi:MAG: hypothetical protein HKN03_14185 [Acidimicrobiales bacterium]|nr:hypothetical protein [Acidimicrobiales bacterium]